MKKLLSILGSLSIASVAATSVVACSVPKTDIPVEFTDGTPNGNKVDANTKWKIGNASDPSYNASYSLSDLENSMNGNSSYINGAVPGALTFDALNTNLLQIMTFDKGLMVKTQNNQAQLRQARDTFLGREAGQNDLGNSAPMDVASVDGIYMKGVDSNNKEDYYNKFDNTHINSLNGLLDLYNYSKEHQSWTPTGDLNESLNQADKLFAQDGADELMNAMFNSKMDSAFSKISYKVPGGFTVVGTQSNRIETFDTTKSNDTLKVYGAADYTKNNGIIPSKDDDNKTINNLANNSPFGAVVLTPEDEKFDTTTVKVVPNDLNKNRNKAIDSNFTSDTSTVGLQEVLNKGKETGDTGFSSIGSIYDNLNQYVVKKVKSPITVNYEFTPNTKLDSSKQITYTVSFDIDNLSEIYSPVITPLQSNQVTNVSVDNGNITLTTSKKITKDNLSKATIELNDGTKIDNSNVSTKGDNTIVVSGQNLENDSLNAITISGDEDDGFVDDANTFKFESSGKTTESDYQANYQINWLFRGYKFLDLSNVDQNATKGISLVDANDKGIIANPNKAVQAEINHNYRDLNTTNWNITVNKPTSNN